MNARMQRGGMVVVCGAILAVAGLPAGVWAQPEEEIKKKEQPEDPSVKKQREAEAEALRQMQETTRLKEAAATGRARAVPQGPQPPQPLPGRGPTGATGTAPQPGATGATGAAPAHLPITVIGGEGSGANGGQPTDVQPGEISLSGEGIDLKLFVNYVAGKLKINIIAAESLSGTVVLNAPVVIKESELLRLLDALLEQHGFTIILDPQTGFYKIVGLDGIPPSFDSDSATTRVIPTGAVRPSSLSDVISSQIGVTGATAAPPPGTMPAGGGGGRGRLNYVDDLGVIIVTDSPRRIELIQQMVNTMLRRIAEQKFIRFELAEIAAPAARSRVLDLVGRGAGTGFPGASPAAQNGGIALPGQGATNFDNLSDRLTADPATNALILRGYDEEVDRIKEILAVIDRPNKMEYQQYFGGSAAAQIAQLAERFGFGSVETVETMQAQTQNSLGNNANRAQQPQLNLAQFGVQQQTSGSIGGPVLVVDSSAGTITYNGTATQQAALKRLIDTFNPQQELVEYRAYKIKNMKAAEMSDLLQGLIFNEQLSGSSDISNPFLSGTGSSRRNNRNSGSGGLGSRSNQGFNSQGFNNQGFNNQGFNQQGGTEFGRMQSNRNRQRTASTAGTSGGGGGGGRGPVAFSGQPAQGESAEGVASISSQEVFVLPDESNNQVVVKARSRDHQQIKKLIDKLDQRRPQVYIDVQIVSVSAQDDFRLAFETQLINANGTGGVVNTNFSLGAVGTQGTAGPSSNATGILSQKVVATGLGGLTAAIIRSDQVPIVMTALKRNSDTRILSSPQLLMDDNEEGEIVSLDEQPTTGSSIGTATTTTSFTRYVSAGTTLSVVPHISEGGYMRLEYDIELSNFIGTGGNGIPPPRQTKNVSSTSVTIPGNATIIVGGIKVEQKSNTKIRVPLLGDIPIIGALFSDTNRTGSSTRLYIFITPRIMRDVNFGDPSLLTKGPALDAGIDLGIPELKCVMIEANDSAPERIVTPAPPPLPVKLEEKPPRPVTPPGEMPAGGGEPR